MRDTSEDQQAVYALLDRIQTAMPMAQYRVTPDGEHP